MKLLAWSKTDIKVGSLRKELFATKRFLLSIEYSLVSGNSLTTVNLHDFTCETSELVNIKNVFMNSNKQLRRLATSTRKFLFA